VYCPAAELRPIGSIVVVRLDPDLAPTGVDAEEDVLQPVERNVRDRVRFVDVDAERVEEQLDVGRARVTGLGRPGVDRELRATGLDILDTGVPTVGDVLEADAVVQLVVGLEKLEHVGLGGAGARAAERRRAGGHRYGQRGRRGGQRDQGSGSDEP
jgi:hypothetical protein